MPSKKYCPECTQHVVTVKDKFGALRLGAHNANGKKCPGSGRQAK